MASLKNFTKIEDGGICGSCERDVTTLWKDRDCDISLCTRCRNLHTCGELYAQPCPGCGGWGKTRKMRMGVMAFSLDGLFDPPQRCETCNGTGRA